MEVNMPTFYAQGTHTYISSRTQAFTKVFNQWLAYIGRPERARCQITERMIKASVSREMTRNNDSIMIPPTVDYSNIHKHTLNYGTIIMHRSFFYNNLQVGTFYMLLPEVRKNREVIIQYSETIKSQVESMLGQYIHCNISSLYNQHRLNSSYIDTFYSDYSAFIQPDHVLTTEFTNYLDSKEGA